MRDADELIEDSVQLVTEVVEDALSRGTKDYNKFRNAIRDALGDYIWKKNKRRPMILPIIMEEES